MRDVGRFKQNGFRHEDISEDDVYLQEHREWVESEETRGQVYFSEKPWRQKRSFHG
jgi:hypothetical protein